MKDKTDPYEVLKYLLPKPGSPSHSGPLNVHSPRLEAIRFLLKPFEVIEQTFRDETRVNLYVRLPGWDDRRKTTVFVAHWDVVDPEHCCLDNTASVANLIALLYRLQGKPTKNAIVLALTDGEEVGALGARELSRVILAGEFGQVEECINLELSGVGDKWFVDGKGGLAEEPGYTKVTDIPFSDATILNNEGIPTKTIGTLPESELLEVIEGGYCDTWGVCHSPRDVFGLANKDDMNAFIDGLERYLTK